VSRFCGDHDVTAVLEAADHWRKSCLEKDGSVFLEEDLWKLNHFETLNELVVQNPDVGDRNFFEKLESQLETADEAVKKLAAEMLWVKFLCSSNIQPSKKREGIQTIWSWTKDKLSENLIWLNDGTFRGVGSSGTGYNTNRGREFQYFIRLMVAFKSLDVSIRQSLMNNALDMSKWLENIPENDSRQFRHMFLFLLFPDECERIFGGTDRKKIIQSFTDMSKSEVDKLSAKEVDLHLKEIRQKNEAIHKTKNLDFYTSPLQDEWNGGKKSPTKTDRLLKSLEQEMNKLKNCHDLNTILYGPPGTGKTYNTVNKALEICGVEIEGLDRTEIKERFDELMEAGQIVFTTFHQSMTYEDFIEGIKPNIASEEESVTYKINEGIFYRLAIEASFSIVEKSQSHSAKDVLDFSSAYDSYIEIVSDRLEKSEDVDLKTKSGGTIYIDSISDHGNISIKHSGKEKTYIVSKTRLTKLNSAIDDLEGVTNINDTIRSIIGGCNSSAYWAVLNEIRKKKPQQDNHNQRPEKISFNDKKEAVKSFLKQDYQGITGRPYVLIIDEINRGNISEIFGELITLIEEDKRLGREEAIEVTLPYSKEKFGVPSNLFIIGTMNTADRSIEALDTALRRRFSFIEMLPDSDLIKTEGKLKDSDGKIDELDLPEVLNTINLRIEKLLDHDHAIGHSYFLSIENLNDLKTVFHNKLIPLLQEYFFGDIGKIGLVIGKGFFEDKKDEQKDGTDFFADFGDYDTGIFMEKKIYHLVNVEKLSDDKFREALKNLLNKKSGDE